MDHTILGKILATVITAAIDAGAIALDSGGILTNPVAVGSITQGFLNVWLTHPASGQGVTPPLTKGGVGNANTGQPINAGPSSTA